MSRKPDVASETLDSAARLAEDARIRMANRRIRLTLHTGLALRESAADQQVGSVFTAILDQRVDQVGTVLAIRVALHHRPVAVGYGVTEATPQGATHPEVERQAKHLGPRCCGRAGGVVHRAVVDDHHVEAVAPETLHHRPDRSLLVECRDNDQRPRTRAQPERSRSSSSSCWSNAWDSANSRIRAR